jgi:hypothetical protein
MKSRSPSPGGCEGKPISLNPYTFDEVVEGMLSTPPPVEAENEINRKSVSNRKETET